MSNDDSTISVAYKKLAPLLYRYGRRFTGDRGAVWDSIHETFLKVCEKNEAAEIRNTKFYMLRAFKNTLMNELKRKKQTINIESIEYNYRWEKSGEDILIETEETQRFKALLEKALECLAPKEKEVIRLFFVEMRK